MMMDGNTGAEDDKHDVEFAASASSVERVKAKPRASVHSLMKSKKEEDTFDLAEDVYAFIFVAPVCSVPFVFGMYVICVKCIIYGILVSDIKWTDNEPSQAAWAAKFFLIPVALSMQADLMHAFFCFANVMYDPSILETTSTSATKFKLYISFLLRTFDGLFSLTVNFYLMLVTAETLSVFTNFAALYFLQDIDDVFYGLVQLGFFGDKMEYMSQVCAGIKFPRRNGNSNTKCCMGCFRVTHLDSILWVLSFVILLASYSGAVSYIFVRFDGFS